MPIIDKNNVYIAKSLIKASIKPDLILTVLQLKTDNDTDPRTTCNCCSSAYQLEKTIHIFEDRVYKFTYYNENISYENMIGEVTHIECDPNFPDSGYVEVKAYLTEEDVKRKVYANIKRIPIANIQNAIDITPYESPVEQGDDYKLMILGISAQKVRALVINLKMINDDELDQAVKEVSLIVGNRYKVCYNSKDNELDCLIGTLTGMVEIPNLDQEFGTGYNPNCGFVRENGECKYPEYNKYYLGNNNESCCDGCPIAGNCSANEEISFYNNTYEKDRFLRLPENMVSDVLLTFDVTSDTDTTTVYKKIYLSQIRDVCSMYLIEDPASTDLKVEIVNDVSLFIYAKNSRMVRVYINFNEEEIPKDIENSFKNFPEFVYSVYPNNNVPITITLPEYYNGQIIVQSEFVDDTVTTKKINVNTGGYHTLFDKIKDFENRFNTWIVNHLYFNGDHSKPLLTVNFDDENNKLIFTLNYYNLMDFSSIDQFIKLLNPDIIDDFIINVILKSFDSTTNIILERYNPPSATETPILIGDSSCINNIKDVFHFNNSSGLELSGIFSLINGLISKLITNYYSEEIEENLYRLTCISYYSTFIFRDSLINDDTGLDLDILYNIKFNSYEDKEKFEGYISLLRAIINPKTSSYLIPSETPIPGRDFIIEPLMININIHTVFENYLNNIIPCPDHNYTQPLKTFTIGSILEVFNSIDILNTTDPFWYWDPNQKSYFNDLLIMIQKFNRLICHIVCNSKEALLYKNDNTKIKLIDDDKIFNMEPIDTSYAEYDPKGFYKLCKAFKNVFTDFVNNSSLEKFYYHTDDQYIPDVFIFGLTSKFKIGNFQTLTIPFSIKLNAMQPME